MTNNLPLIDLGGIWHIAYFIGMVPAILLFSCQLKWPAIPAIFFCYVIFWCLFIVEWPSAHFGPYTASFQSTAAQSLIEAIFIPILAIHFSRYIEKLIPVLALFSATCVWFSWPGLMHAPSFNSALAVLCLPAIASSWIYTFVMITVLFHHGATALLMLAAQLIVMGWDKISRWVIGWAISILALSAYFTRTPFNSANERIMHWLQYMPFWAHRLRYILFGVGPGSFIWYSIITHKYSAGIYLQMHNDWLQILWELGMVGFVLAGLLCYAAISRAQNVNIKIGILSAMVFALTYCPLRYFPSALLIAWYFSKALIIEDVEVNFAGFSRPIERDD